ncbi:hypothetical protein TBLA_0F01270 [Henningerozyma blattae CBS 6284]|uniref:DNA mismatch repair protein HSM3 n=1 Tax=Henningerozyma blattae (strain ATCC 34711 / CBS 6284 / DSM 70876 / NBRC 10599 / NRRL Y-10934 / UCD 77-7) TaxID=1071380 RepID=I2H5L8_HENB6|nr:hypothetical protein TBLA_0F01270 [Tetrapisispora blattae CBS 6284]CCH61670.1 hypothetical protein TBLA_0F01270 [Tetrapisispora blattae CBS 6284]
MQDINQTIDLLNTALESINTTLQNINTTLQNINTTSITQLNKLIDVCSLNLSQHTPVPSSLLVNLKQTLLHPPIGLDFDSILELLQKIISITDFDTITNIYSLSDLQSALDSNIPQLAISTLHIINSSPSPLCYPHVLQLYFNVSTQISIVSQIEIFFSNNPIFKSYLLTQTESHICLQSARSSNDPIIFARALTLLQSLFTSFNTTNSFNLDKKIFFFSSNDLFKLLQSDILCFINLTNYHTSLLDSILTSTSHWSLPDFQPIFNAYGSIYKDIDTYPDIQSFAKTHIFKLFAKISYLNDSSIYHALDTSYLKISPICPDIVDFLSFTNPNYLFIHHNSLCTRFSIFKPSNIPILRNLITLPQTFQLITPNINSLLQLPYLEQMVLLQKMSQYHHCIVFLINNCPSIISNLLNTNKSNIIESETVELRNEVLENFLHFDKSILDVWFEPLKKEYNSTPTYTPQIALIKKKKKFNNTI